MEIELGLCPTISSHQFAACCASHLSWQSEVSPRHGPELFYCLGLQDFSVQMQTKPPFCASPVELCHNSLCVWQDQQFFVQFVCMDIVMNGKKIEEMLMGVILSPSKINNLTIVWKGLFYYQFYVRVLSLDVCVLC